MLILLDTSVWINLLSAKPKCHISPTGWQKIAICPPVIQEILQGVPDFDVRRKLQDRLLSLPCVDDPMPLTRFLATGELYSTGRQKGHTIRSSVDCLIAAIAIAHHLVIWHRDRDFDALAKFTSLRTYPENTL